MRRILHIFVLLVTFLFAQGGVVAHAASHLAPVSHAGDEGAPADAACELCVGYAQLGGGAPPSVSPLLPDCAARHETPAVAATVFITRSAFHSRARAPPIFS